ncbi:acyl-CoA dehydrogenase family protein [Novosphingobium tardum]|uniref:Acyl-CoA dehydrogenase family protein n=1 Tax=Novosphingobium tardum TaxID=1538021 RepID=A0ABV8RUI7_9SPHN
MDLSLDSDQEALVTATADWCRANMPLEHVRDRPVDLWRDLEAMGWTAMTAPGLDLSHATEAMVFAELGRFLAPVALLSSAVAARWLGSADKVALALDDGNRLRVFDGESATLAIGVTSTQASVYRLPEGLSGAPGLDLSVSLTLLETAPAAEPLGNPHAALHLQLLAAAFTVGCAEAARDMAAGYAIMREQFERPIGWFQALKHMIADTAVRAAVARSQLCYAACALDANAPDAAFHIAAARRLADQAAIDNSRTNIQVHGGIGMTDEAFPHFCLKRAHLLSFIAPAEQGALLGEAS